MLRRFLALSALIGIVLVSSPWLASASAADAPTPVGTYKDSTGGTCGSTSSFKPPQATAVSSTDQTVNYLPIDRWNSASQSFHTRLNDGHFGLSSMTQRFSRDIVAPLGLSIGNTMWQVSTGAVQLANHFSVLDSAGCSADKASYKIGLALEPVLAVLASIGIVMVLWRARTNPSAIKDLAKIAAVVCVYLILLSGAHATQGAGRPGVGSPYWFALATTQMGTNIVASTNLINQFTDLSPGAGGISAAPAASNNALSCGKYVAQLRTDYTNSQPDPAAAQMPIVLSALWEQSGLVVWTNAQFGMSNPYGDNAYCHVLDRASGITGDAQWHIMQHADPGLNLPAPGNGPGADQYKLLAQGIGGGTNNTDDQAAVFWAACTYDGTNWNLDPAWQYLDTTNGGTKADYDNAGSTISNTDCGKNGWDNFNKASKFDWGTGTGYNDKNLNGTGDAPTNFLANLHGDSSNAAYTLVLIYVVSSFVNLIAFGLIAIGVIVAKIASIAMILLIFLVVCASVIPGRDKSKLGKFFKFWLGCILYSMLLTVVLALLVVMTSAISQAGVGAFGPGSVMAILWLGFAPITSLFVLHLLMKKTMGTSIFKPGAALALGAAAGGAGGAAAGGVDRLARRGGSMARRGLEGAALYKTGKRAGGGGKSDGKGGKHGMQAEGKSDEPGGALVPEKSKDQKKAEQKEGRESLGINGPKGYAKDAAQRAKDKAAQIKQKAAYARAHPKEAAKRGALGVGRKVKAAAGYARQHPVKAAALLGGAALLAPMSLPLAAGAALGTGAAAKVHSNIKKHQETGMGAAGRRYQTAYDNQHGSAQPAGQSGPQPGFWSGSPLVPTPPPAQGPSSQWQPPAQRPPQQPPPPRPTSGRKGRTGSGPRATGRSSGGVWTTGKPGR